MHKQYLHATNLLLEAVSLGKGCLEGVEGLKDLSHELESKKEVWFCLFYFNDYLIFL